MPDRDPFIPARYRGISNALVGIFLAVAGTMAATFLIYAWSSTSILIAVGAVLLPFIIFRPAYGVLLYFLIYPMVPASQGLNALKLGVFLLTIIILALWVFRSLLSYKTPWTDPEYRWMFIFMAYLCFSPLLGMKNGFTLIDWARDIAPLLNFLLIPVMVEYFKQDEYHWLIYAVLFPGLLGTVLANINQLYGMGFSLPFVTVGVYTWLATFFAFWYFQPALMFGLGLLMYLHHSKLRWLWLPMAGMGLFMALFNTSRTYWLGILLMAILLVWAAGWTNIRRASNFPAVIASIVVILAFSVTAFGNRQLAYGEVQSSRLLGLLKPFQEESFVARGNELSQTLELFAASPLWGQGYGYQYLFWRHDRAFVGLGMLSTNYTHNDLTNVLAKGGAIGFVLFGMMLYGFGVGLDRRRQRRPYRDSIWIWATFGILVILESLFVGSSTPVYQSREWGFLVALLIALGLGYERPYMT